MSARIVYCVLPAELAPQLHDLLRRHFRDDRGIEVIVEQRGRERRSEVERRLEPGAGPRGVERRRIKSASGRRVADRRAELAAVSDPPPLPRRARRHADRIAFVARQEPSTAEAEDRDTARLVTRFQAGEQDAFVALYTRYFDRVYGYLRYALADRHEAEDVAQQVFIQLIEKIHTYERRRQPFRAWLFVIVRNLAIDHLRRNRGMTVLELEEVNRRREQSADAEASLEAVSWISDRDLLLFLDRLPAAQRQVLLLRYMLDLPTDEIARTLDRSPDDVRMLQHRALRFLKARLSAVGRAPKHGGGHRVRSRRRRPRLTVVRSRRFMLLR